MKKQNFSKPLFWVLLSWTLWAGLFTPLSTEAHLLLPPKDSFLKKQGLHLIDEEQDSKKQNLSPRGGQLYPVKKSLEEKRDNETNSEANKQIQTNNTKLKDHKQIVKKLKKWSTTQLRPSMQLWSKYKWAQLSQKTKPLLSCRLFMELSHNPHFPLADLSLWRAMEACPQLPKRRPKPPPKWLKNLSTDIQIANAKRMKNPSSHIEGLVLKSKGSLPLSQKVELVKTALRVAQKNNLKDSLNPLQQRLYQLAPRFIARPQASQYLFVANDWLKNRQFKKALTYYKKVINGNASITEKIKAFQGACRLHKLKRDRATYLKASLQLSRFIKRQYKKNQDPQFRKLSFETDLKLAKIYWTQGQRDSARRVLKDIQKTFQKTESMAEVYWVRGRMHEEKGNPQGALWWYQQTLKEEFQNPSFKLQVMWYQAWNLRKLKKHQLAIHLFSEIIKLSEKVETTPARALYWKAISHRELKEEHLAKTTFEKLISEDPMGYYGLLAHRALGHPIHWPGEPLTSSPMSTRSQLTDSQLTDSQLTDFRLTDSRLTDSRLRKKGFQTQYLNWLLSLSENKIAKLYLDEMSKSYRSLKNHKSETWTQIFTYYAKAGHYLELFYQLGQLPPKLRRHILASQPELIFPRPFHKEVQQAAQKLNIQEEYIYSIMRQESAFNPRARSSADALGLLQVLPELGIAARRTLNIPYDQMEDLYNPSINIQVGASYLKKLWNESKEQFILSTATYNANKKAIRHWLKNPLQGGCSYFYRRCSLQRDKNLSQIGHAKLYFLPTSQSK